VNMSLSTPTTRRPPPSRGAALDHSFSGDGQLVLDIHGQISDILVEDDHLVAVGYAVEGNMVMAAFRLLWRGLLI
jgi:hypothetical protein